VCVCGFVTVIFNIQQARAVQIAVHQ